MATPHVAGIAALYSETDSLASPSVVFDTIMSWATSGVLSNIGSGSPNLLAYSNPPLPLAVSLEGPSQIADGAIACSWWADTSGGVTPYSWVWTMDGDTVSTSSSQFDYFGDPLTDDFILEVIVEDAESSRKNDILEVEVGPFQECEGGLL